MVTFEQIQDEQARQATRHKLQQEAEKMRALKGPIKKLTSTTSNGDGKTSVEK